MRIVYFGNNKVALKVLNWLRQNNEDIEGLVLHPVETSKYREEIIEISGIGDSSKIFNSSLLRQQKVIAAIKNLKPDIGLSIFFGYILKPEMISLFPEGIINLHPSFLPYNKGAYPNVWSIVDGTPAGVTMHYIDEGIDTGKIIAQSKVKVELVDTGESLYNKLETTSIELFKKTWPDIKQKKQRSFATKLTGTHHMTADTAKIDCIDLDKTYQAKDLINIIRARTFPPYNGSYFIHNGRKIFMRMSFTSEDES